MEGLNWQVMNIPLAAGLAQRSDDRARPSQALDIALDVQFDELGGVQTRKPFALLPVAIEGGGALADVRKPQDNGPELLCFTKDTLYSYADALSKWVSRGPHLAVTVEENTVSAMPADHISGDRAELGGVVVYTWEVNPPAGGTQAMYIEARSKVTGAVILPATSITYGMRPRIVALSTRFLLLWNDALLAKLYALALDPANLGTSIAGTPTVVVTASPITYYDVERIPGTDTAAVVAAKQSDTTQYTIFKLSNAAAISSSSTKVRTSYGPLAVACTPDGSTALVVRSDESAGAHDILGDLITISSLADTAHINKALGTAPAGANTLPQQVTAAFFSNSLAQAFWHYGETPLNPAISLQPTVKTNSLTTGGVLGTESTFAIAQGLGSRAFMHDGSVYVHLSFAQPTEHRPTGGTTTFGPTLQNSLFLYRHDKHLVAKIAMNASGGHPARRGCLPGVANVGTNQYAWCATERRFIPSDSDRFVFTDTPATAARYSDRGPRDVTVTFDDDAARRCVRLGETLYIVGGLLLQYDGRSIVEVGWQVMPFIAGLLETGTGALVAGTYAYRPSAASRNAKGELDRSSTAIIGELPVIGAPPNGITITASGPVVSRRPIVTMEFWRTPVNPGADALFNLVSSPDPADSGAASNAYHSYDLSAFSFTAALVDQLVDTDITPRPAHPVTGATLEYLAPPAASVMIATEDRLILGNVAGDPDRLWYSRRRLDGEVAAFHGSLVVEVPPAGGDITALAVLPNSQTLIAFRETAVYALAGDGFDNTLGGSNYGPARQLASDVGAVSQESVVVTPFGLLFQSRKGWHIVDQGQGVQYIGAPVSDYDAEPVLAAHLVESQHQVRILTGSRMLVWDYLAKQWAEWSIAGGLGACLWNGTHVYLDTTGLRQQLTAYTALTYGLDIETAWIKPTDLQGFARVRKLQLLGQLMSSDLTHLRIRIAYDYNSTYVDDKYWPVSPVTVDQPLQFKIGPRRQQVQAVKIRITAIRRYTDESLVEVNGAPTGEALKLTGLALELGMKRGAYPRLPAAQRS